MSKHFLSLTIPSTYNPKVINVIDESIYADDIPVSCGKLEIYPPGYNTPAVIDTLQGFNLRIGACLLGIQTTNCGHIQYDLSDGIYIIRYSVAPNEKVFVEYNYLRITSILNAYYQLLSQTMLSPCQPEEKTVNDLEELHLIKCYIDVAKAKVEVDHEPQDGLDLLVYARRRLEKFILNGKCKLR